MKKIEINDPDKSSNTGAYSAAVSCAGWVFVSGQGPIEMSTGRILNGTIAEETLRTLNNLERVLKAAGCSRQDVVKCTCYLADIEDFQEFDRAYATFFGDGIRPARTTVGAALVGIKVEIDAIARVPAIAQPGGDA